MHRESWCIFARIISRKGQKKSFFTDLGRVARKPVNADLTLNVTIATPTPTLQVSAPWPNTIKSADVTRPRIASSSLHSAVSAHVIN